MTYRIPLGSRAWVLWKDADGAMSIQYGRAGEIGQLGLVVMADSAPPRGTEVELIIEVQRDSSFPLRLAGRGEVLRSIGPKGEPHSFAVKAFLQEIQDVPECARFIRRHSQPPINKTQLAGAPAQAMPTFDAA